MTLQSEYISDFPPLDQATPEGLLAIGGDLSEQRLIDAYSRGIFPWFNPGQPILWWSPDPRLVLYPAQIRISRSLGKTLRQNRFQFSADQCFERVIEQCAEPRRGYDSRNSDSWSWITPEMAKAYSLLHRMGLAHSIEVWRKGNLVGGLYGVAMGRVFFGESMFSIEADSSKCALVYLCRLLMRKQFKLIDCQVASDHLLRLGAVNVSRSDFSDILSEGLEHTTMCEPWHLDESLMD